MVSKVCAGTMTWGSFVDKEEDAYAQLDALVEAGVNFFDTAELYPVAFKYGKTTEQWIGNWLQKRISEGKFQREDIYIATKCNPSGVGAPKKGKHGFDVENLTASCKASLERLQCDYIDLYQLHWPCRDIPLFGPASYQNIRNGRKTAVNKGEAETFEEQVLSIKSLLDAGLIKYWGLSNETAYGITMFCITCDRLGVARPISVQNDFSLNDRSFEGDTLEACYRFNLVGLPYGNLSGGALTGKYSKSKAYEHESDRPLNESRHVKTPDFQSRYMNPMALKASEKYSALAKEYGLTPTELALAWSNAQWYNGSVIIGTTTVRQVQECVNAFKITLPDELLRKIDEIHEEFRNPTAYYADSKMAKNASWLKE